MPHYYLIDSLGSRIALTNVWFIEDMATKQQRDNAAFAAASKHHYWKVYATIEYSERCRFYVYERRRWEWKVLQDNIYRKDLRWPTDLPASVVLQLANPDTLIEAEDYRNIVESEDGPANVKFG